MKFINYKILLLLILVIKKRLFILNKVNVKRAIY